MTNPKPKSRSNDSRKAIADEAAAAMESLPARFRRSTRLCLSCRRPFTSQWCGNRMCRSCTNPGHGEMTKRPVAEQRV